MLSGGLDFDGFFSISFCNFVFFLFLERFLLFKIWRFLIVRFLIFFKNLVLCGFISLKFF